MCCKLYLQSWEEGGCLGEVGRAEMQNECQGGLLLMRLSRLCAYALHPRNSHVLDTHAPQKQMHNRHTRTSMRFSGGEFQVEGEFSGFMMQDSRSKVRG